MIESVEMEAVSKDEVGFESEEGMLGSLMCNDGSSVKVIVLKEDEDVLEETC